MYTGTLDMITPTVNFSARATAEAGTDWGYRKIPDNQLFYVVSGCAELEIGGQKVAIRPGECVCYGPECQTKLTAIRTTDYISVHFHWHASSPLPVHPGLQIKYGDPGSISAPQLSVFHIPSYGEVKIPTLLTIAGLEPILSKMVNEYESELPGYTLTLRSLMMQAITLICRQLLGNDLVQGSRNKIEPAIQAMQDEPCINWSVAALASLCGYHPVHFTKLFKHEMGVTPKHFIIRERIKRAKLSLLQGEKLELIAERFGFKSLHYFSYQFKQETGLTPTEFRMNGRTGGDG